MRFVVANGDRLPFDNNSFDGVLLNEVLEHVADDALTMREIARVLRPEGVLALFSPNRWFPFEGHGARWSETRVLMRRPVPLMPWLPKRSTSRFATARNYWPHELSRLVLDADLEIVTRSWALAQFAQYPWLRSMLTSGIGVTSRESSDPHRTLLCGIDAHLRETCEAASIGVTAATLRTSWKITSRHRS